MDCCRGDRRLISGFFLYTGEYDAAEGAPTSHNELDVEFVWGLRWEQAAKGGDGNRTALQTNFFTDGLHGNKKMHLPAFDVAQAFHRYSIKWTSAGATWYVDGSPIRTVRDGSTPQLHKSGPLKLFANIWAVADSNRGAQNWAGGPYVHDDGLPPVTTYRWIAYTKGEDCRILPDEERGRRRRR